MLTLAVSFALACQRETPDVSQNNPTRSNTSAEAPSVNPSVVTPPSTDIPSRAIAGAAQGDLRVELIEYAIRMPDQLAAGPQKFSIQNGGKELHSFAIEGGELRARLPTDLPRGDTASMTLDLKPGTYTIYCPVDGHRAKGMTRTLVVQ